MAKIQLYSKDRVRITSGYKKNNFIDVSGHDDELCMSVEFYPTMQYIEIRKKSNVCKQFLFKKKGDKKYFNFGYWEDAEVIFALNEVTH